MIREARPPISSKRRGDWCGSPWIAFFIVQRFEVNHCPPLSYAVGRLTQSVPRISSSTLLGNEVIHLPLAGGHKIRALWSQSGALHGQDGNLSGAPGGHNRLGGSDNVTACREAGARLGDRHGRNPAPKCGSSRPLLQFADYATIWPRRC